MKSKSTLKIVIPGIILSITDMSPVFIMSTNEDLMINNMDFNHTDFYVDEAIEFPSSINSLDTLIIGIWFFPQSDGDYNGELTISNNSPVAEFNIDFDADALTTDNGIGSLLWSFQITDGYDPSPKAMLGIEDVSGDNVGVNSMFVVSITPAL